MGISGAIEIARGSVTIGADIAKFETSMRRVEQHLRRVGVSMRYLTGAAGIAAGFIAASRAISTVVDQAINFESRMSQVRKTTGMAGDELKKFQERIVDIATSLPGVKLGELTDIAAMAGRLGIASDKIERFTRDIAMIRVALDDVPADEA